MRPASEEVGRPHDVRCGEPPGQNGSSPLSRRLSRRPSSAPAVGADPGTALVSARVRPRVSSTQAHLPEPKLASRLAVPLERCTPRTVTDPETLGA
ncbi:hypothetical protein [Streptomyces sp. NPDC005486]|uniref:hypothetical protein n=1 Tax=Streptomyces sp. NPDC005486 TaxID=3155345 RepID=UPI0033A6E24A